MCVCFQGQACVLVLRAMQSRDVQQLLDGAPWTELCAKVAAQLAEVGSRPLTQSGRRCRQGEAETSGRR